MSTTNLFYGVESLPASSRICLNIHIVPRPISERLANCCEREESKVAVCHVAVLSLEEKLRRDLNL